MASRRLPWFPAITPTPTPVSDTATFTVTDSNGVADPTPDSRTITVTGGGGSQATFSAVQSQIFTPSCAFSGCHGGGSPAEGLNLTAGMAYANIVNVRSSQQGNRDRIEPDEPDASYLYLKVTGYPSISGVRMPRSAPALSQQLLDLLRDWIERVLSQRLITSSSVRTAGFGKTRETRKDHP